MHRAVILGATFFILLSAPFSVNAALIDQVNQAFRQIHGRTPTVSEWTYWAGRVQRGEKKTFQALVGAIAFQAGGGSNTPVQTTNISAQQTTTAKSFKVDKNLYPSPHNPNFLPDGTLVKSPTSPEVFYIRNGKKSWVLPKVINVWLNENHFFKHDIIITVSADDLARYPQTSSVNNIYIGKVLKHPDGTQYFIDDKLRKRKISPTVRAAFKMPGGNLYSTSAVHLREFKTGPALNSSKYPGGMVVYTGAWHGGRMWRIKEAPGGVLMKHLYLSDYIYEADGNPDESLRAPANATILARHARGSNIERYPDGWVVGLGNNIYVVQGGKLRLIASPSVFAAIGYKQKYVLKHYPEFLKRYPHGYSIGAFKSVVAGSAGKGVPKAAPNTASHLIKVRPGIRTMINTVNDYYLTAYDKEPTMSENKFWVDYLYNGEVNNVTDLKAAMKRAAVTGRKPSRTSRIVVISSDRLKSHWFPYLFYFVHQSEPNSADKDYWYNRIRPGDRDSIEKLGGTLQWVKENYGVTHR